jgi:predicted PurR-regulated permease PerM
MGITEPIVNRLTGKEDIPATPRIQLDISWASIFRVLAGVLFAYVAILLWPIFKLLTLAVLIAVALYPIVRLANRRKLPRSIGLLLATVTLLVVVVSCVAVIAPMVFHQMATLGESLPRLREQIIAQLPSTGFMHDTLQKGINSGTVSDSKVVLERMLMVVEMTLGGLVQFVVVIALAIYLMADGPRAVKWLIVFFPIAEREKISQAMVQISRLISSYVAGQFLVSAFAAAYLFILLKLLGVPMALLLGIIAGVCDILPIIGFFIAVFLAMAIGLSVSPATAALIFFLYGAYHLFENFFVIPRVYGKKLKLSKLAVPLAVAAGGFLAGVVGAIAVLPLVAAYPVVERLWLAPKLAPDTVKAHEEEFP